jgi:ferritin-like metal-binding protein YciE
MSPKLAGTEELATAYEEHRTQTERHSRLVEECLQARGAKSSSLKDAAMKLGALNWGTFFGAQVDTPAKLAGFAYAFEHLEVAAYELLQRVARRADDSDTVAVAGEVLLEERAAGAHIHAMFDQALEASLREAGLRV